MERVPRHVREAPCPSNRCASRGTRKLLFSRGSSRRPDFRTVCGRPRLARLPALMRGQWAGMLALFSWPPEEPPTSPQRLEKALNSSYEKGVRTAEASGSEQVER